MTHTSQVPVKVAIVGCGQRGTIYGKYAIAHPTQMQVVAIAEASPTRRARMQAAHGIPDAQTHSTWESLLSSPQVATAVIISTQDSTHHKISTKFAAHGYHILLEKPMATTLRHCHDILTTVKSANVIFGVCHVLRYTPHNRQIKQIIERGDIGEVLGIQHLEPIGHTHFAHSFVRGNWRNERSSSFALMTKSCHDIDIILGFVGAKPLRVSSFGARSHFTNAKKPKEARGALRCTECEYEANCAYSANRIYLEPATRGHTAWPLDVITDVVDIENVARAIETGPYGRCVYECDNDVCDNQVVNIEFEGGKSASFSMVAFTKEMCVRKTRVFGSKGEIVADGSDTIEVFDFLSGTSSVYHPATVSGDLSGHGGGDMGVIEAFIDAVARNDPSALASGVEESFESYMLVFAAEEARLRKSVVELNQFRKDNNIAY